jgi:membrane protein DedA with SNARE-associated domain
VDHFSGREHGVCEPCRVDRGNLGLDSLLTTGYIGLFVFIVLTGFGLPLPEELAVVTAGVLAARGELETLPALVVCMVAALLGDCAVYGLGRWAGRAGGRLRWLMPRVSDERLRSTQALLHRHGFKILLVARFLVGFRFAVYLAVAASRLSVIATSRSLPDLPL